MTLDENEKMPRGTTLELYRFLLKNNNSVGIREIQRRLNLSSPSLVTYHLTKLEDAGLIRKEKGKYQLNKVILDYSVRIRRFLIPRFLFYTVFAFVALMVQLTYLKPSTTTSNYFFSTIIIVACTVFFIYETVKTWIKGRL